MPSEPREDPPLQGAGWAAGDTWDSGLLLPQEQVQRELGMYFL